MNLKSYNEKQLSELKRIRDEVKWLVGEKLGYDPSTTPEGRRAVEEYFADVIVTGAGRYLSVLVQREEKFGEIERATPVVDPNYVPTKEWNVDPTLDIC